MLYITDVTCPTTPSFKPLLINLINLYEMETCNIFTALLAIQDKYSTYFKANQKTIINYIEIRWQKPLTVRIIDRAMPPQLRHDIETLLPIQHEAG